MVRAFNRRKPGTRPASGDHVDHLSFKGCKFGEPNVRLCASCLVLESRLACLSSQVPTELCRILFFSTNFVNIVLAQIAGHGVGTGLPPPLPPPY